jgi:hypothetical protein
MRRLLSLSALLLSLNACTPAQLAGLKTANTVAAGVACGVAAANGTPCTPTETLAALAEQQQKLLEVVADQAAERSDPAVVEALLDALAKSADTQRALAEEVIRLAQQSRPSSPPRRPRRPPAPQTPPAATVPRVEPTAPAPTSGTPPPSAPPP